MQSTKLYSNHLSSMFYVLRRRFQRLWLRIRCRPRPKLLIKRLGRLNSKTCSQNGHMKSGFVQRPIRLASFNAALFSLAPAVLNQSEDEDKKKLTESKPKASTNLQENEISLDSSFSFNNNSIAPMRSPIYFPATWMSDAGLYDTRTILDVLKEVDADVLALQDVKADEEKDMKPLSDLARALGMNYTFAESWAPEYGNAVLSKWPIKSSKVQKIFDDRDFRNVIKATIDVPWTGELNVFCTQLDHLDENWRMKQINAMIQTNNQPHILAGGLNSLDASDYSLQRWNDIVKYYEELGKPSPKVEVTSFLKEKEYTDAKDFRGECEPIVMIAKGQNVQGTCKYGTRVDYIMGSRGLNYTFVPWIILGVFIEGNLRSSYS